MPTATWKSRLRSGSAHCDLQLAVEVRQCPLGSGLRGGRGGDGGGGGRRRRTALIKSNNPPLAGGEKTNSIRLVTVATSIGQEDQSRLVARREL